MQNIMKEIWKEITGYPNYMVSNKGNVKSLNYNHTGREKIMKQYYQQTGYLLIGLSNNGKKWYLVHRLVAQAFIPNPNNLPQVNHKDENKQNNCVQNLEWCNQKYNMNYGTRNKIVAEKLSKPVLQMDKTNKIIAEFPSIMEVKRQLGISQSSISMCCKGKRKTCGGYKWKFKEESVA